MDHIAWDIGMKSGLYQAILQISADMHTKRHDSFFECIISADPKKMIYQGGISAILGIFKTMVLWFGHLSPCLIKKMKKGITLLGERKRLNWGNQKGYIRVK